MSTITDGADDEPTHGRHQEEGPDLPGRRPGGKTRILDELVELTGWHRDYARAALRDALVIKAKGRIARQRRAATG